jgi:hypothetical protein
LKEFKEWIRACAFKGSYNLIAATLGTLIARESLSVVTTSVTECDIVQKGTARHEDIGC